MATTAAAAADLARFRQARVLFAHQSVGENILAGLPAVFQAANQPLARVVETRSPPEGSGYLAHTRVGENTDPGAKLADFAALVDGPFAGRLEVALLKFCYADIDHQTQVPALYAEYRDRLADLAARHPGVSFLAATVPLTTDRSWKARLKAVAGRDDRRGPADNLARHRFNTLVRQDHPRLFDIAAVEAALPGSATLRRHDGQEYHVLDPALSSDPGHLNQRGSEAAAGALVAAVAGVLPR